VEKRLSWLGIVLCGLVIATTAVLGGIRVVEGPRTVNHDKGRCQPPKTDTTCVHDRYSGSPVSRPWMILAGTLSICAGAIGFTLLKHRRQLNAA
jgi:hypothetical protein